MHKGITLFTFIIITPLLQAASCSTDTSASCSSSVAPSFGMLTLISRDEKEIPVHLATGLKYCGLVKQLEDFSIQHAEFAAGSLAQSHLTFSELSTEAVHFLVELMYEVERLETGSSIVSSLRLAQSIPASPSDEAIQELLGAIDMLQLQPVISDTIAHFAITRVRGALRDAKNLAPQAKSALAKQLYLMQPKGLIPQGWVNDQNDIHFGVSVQDLIDYGKLPAIEVKERGFGYLRGNELNLRDLYINDLTGISGIAGIDRVRKLDLSKNRIESISFGVFDGFTYLERLYLDNNRIESIAPLSFAGLNGIVWIHLGENRIDSLAPGVFATLPQLQWLYLGKNLITQNREERESIIQELRAIAPDAKVHF